MNEAARAAWARLSDLSKPIRGQPDLLAQTILHGLVVEKTDWEEVEVAHMEEIGLGLKTTAYAMWLRENGLRQCRNPRKWVRFVLAPQTASDIAEAAKGGALMRPVGKCAHCGADTFLGSLVIGPGLLGAQPVYCATEGCVAAAFSKGLGPLVACPLCGERKGYILHEGTSYRWWRVCCGHCGADVAECRSDGGTTLGAPKPERWPAADHAWAQAGKHAEELRQAVRALAALNAWHHFGECRAWGVGPIISPQEADELARRVLRA